jgi:hypothetical protein
MVSSAPSSIAPDPSSHATSDAVTAPSIGNAATGSLLVRSILESYGKEILESASEQFLDLAVEVRLQTISARELVKLLAKANRLGYEETDTVDDENGAPPVQGGNANSRSKPDAIGTPKPPGAIAGQCRAHSTAPSQPLSLENPRAPNHTNTAEALRDGPLPANAHLNAQRAAPSGKERGFSIQRIQRVTVVQDEASTAAGTARKQRQGEFSGTGSGPRVAARVARPPNVLKRGRAQDLGGEVQSQRPRKLVRASAGKLSLSIPAQPLELVVISDSEPEPEGNDDH